MGEQPIISKRVKIDNADNANNSTVSINCKENYSCNNEMVHLNFAKHRAVNKKTSMEK